MTDSERALAINRAGGSRRTKHRRGRWGPSCACSFPNSDRQAIVDSEA